MTEDNKYDRGTLGWLRELAKKYGKEYGREFILWALENGIFKRPSEVDKDKNKGLYGKAGCKNSKEYQDKNAQKLGYDSNAERVRERRWNKGTYSPMSENGNCSSYFSDITERIFNEFLLTIFEYVEHMNYGNIGFDFICKNPIQEFIDKYPQLKLGIDKEYKIQLKSRCLQYVGKRIGMNFTGIDYNNIADYFILSGWNNRESLVPLHVLMFHRDNIIRGEKFWNRECFYITNNPYYLGQFRKYELDLDGLKKLCAEYGNDK